ncbi:MAG: hypothetical protein WCW01_02400 [Gammaproteobacteria bacterium]
MDDLNTNKTESGVSSPDEYRVVSEDAYSQPAPSPITEQIQEPIKEEKSSLFDKLKSKKILVPVGLVVATLVLMQIMGVFSQKHRDSNIGLGQQIIAKPEFPKPTQAPVAVPAPQPVIAPRPDVDEKVGRQLDAVLHREQQDMAQMEKIGNLLGEGQIVLIGLRKSVEDLSSSVNTLTNKVNVLMTMVKPPEPPKKKKNGIKRTPYHIKAIITGRAWLEDPKGNTITVRIGDIVNGARVEMISPNQGVVLTSSGEMIQYGNNDL